MPWNELRPMDQRLLFIADHLRQVDSVSALCERYAETDSLLFTGHFPAPSTARIRRSENSFAIA